MLQKHFPLSIIFLFLSVRIVFANTSSVSATVVSSTSTRPTAPVLVRPTNNYSTNNPIFTFVWNRPSPLPTNPLDHYDLYIDNSVYANSLPDSLTSSDFYFYTATASSGVFYVTLKQDMSQGYHTWRVAVYDSIGQSAVTGDWNFYLDSIAPFISFTKLNSTAYNWNTSISGTIPEESQRYLTVNSNNPTLNGGVETNANLQISLICPFPIPLGCTSQTWITNSTDGKWSKQLPNLVANAYYTISLSATDATNNSTIFPNFYIKYYVPSAVTPTPTATSTPTPTPTKKPTTAPTPIPSTTITPKPSGIIPRVTATLTPPPELNSLITPTPFIAKAPPAPSLPPQKPKSGFSAAGYGVFILFLLLVLGLPIHLILVSLAVGASFKNIIGFLFTLGFPFLKRKNAQTLPYTFVEIYNPKNVNRKIYKAVSNINGDIYFPTNFPPQIFIILSKVGYDWKNQIAPSVLLGYECLLPIPKRFLGAKENLLNYFYSIKSIPLIVAILTSSIGLYFFPNTYLATYLYLSLQYAFSEYAYPKMVNR